MRLFVAINLPPSIRDAIYADTASLRAATSAVKWVTAPLIHVTLKFLGGQSDALVPDLERIIRIVAARRPALELRTTEFGAFPNFRRARVVWVGVTGETELRALAHDLDQMFEGLGIPAETRSFKAHLTLGRVKREMSGDESRSLAAAAALPREAHSFAVSAVDLMQSELGPGGPRYSVLASAPLHARGP
jgi:2'-5' RNA ligase